VTTRHRTSRISLALLFALLVCGVLPSRVAAQDSEIGVTVQAAEQSGQMGQITRVTQGATFSVRPSVTTSSVGRGSQKLVLDLRCLNNATGQIIPFCNLKLSWKARANSGGHDHHDDGRPKGEFSPPSGNTGSSGVLTTTYTSPEASGIIEAHLEGTLSNGSPVNPSDFTIGVEIPDLTALGASENYTLVGATQRHGDNHYGTPTFNGELRALADLYVAAFPGQRLAYNDMSLPQGGVFDLGGNWGPSHYEHRFGQNCDMRLAPPQQRRRLQQLIAAAGLQPPHIEGDHWHLRQ
jgi:hypothetical protein